MKKLLSVLAGCFVILLCLGRVSNGAEWSDEEKSALSALGTQMDVLIEILQLYNEAALDRPADMSSCLKEMFAMRKLGKCRDKFSYYIPSEEVQGWREGVSGEFGGIGIEVT